jgi:hypothetical protein
MFSFLLVYKIRVLCLKNDSGEHAKNKAEVKVWICKNFYKNREKNCLIQMHLRYLKSNKETNEQKLTKQK